MSRPPAAPPSIDGRADFWAVLGLEPGADADSLKRAFRQQARRWHPDLNGNDPVAEERFKLVNEAYAVLSDPRRRQAWEAGHDGRDGSGSDDPFAAGFPHFEDYLSALFGGFPQQESGAEEEPEASTPPPRAEVAARPASPPPVRAADDLESVVELTPQQALEGSQVELELPDGTAVEVWTPPLAGDGWRLRLAGVGPGGGDHFLQLRVRTDDGLRIDGLRVQFQLDLPPADAALGCQAVVPTLDGPVRLRVPARSSSGRLLRLRGRGLIHDGQRGDQLVEIRIVVVEDLSEAEQALYRRLQELAEERHDG
ncbi:MAG: DnaJ domain-containing protein [Cyanobium sp.]